MCYNTIQRKIMNNIKVSILGSGSKGNCTLIETKDSKILIDCGFSAKETVKRLEILGINPTQINGIFLTHEHKDHTLGVENFASKFEIPIFAHSLTLHEYEKMGLKKSLTLNDIATQDFYFRELTISPFEVSHDSVHCNGYSIYCQGEKFSLATDLGYIDENIIESIAGSETVVIESNHDSQLLRQNPTYPQVLKNRIAGKYGHLSNQDCANAITKLAELGTKNFILAHLSHQNNTTELAKSTTIKTLNTIGADTENDLTIAVATQDNVLTKNTF